MQVVIDSDILIDYLKNEPRARQELALYEQPSISLVTWIEVLVGAKPEEEKSLRIFLGRFEVIQITQEIAEQAILIRREHRLRLPDSIIWATAQVHHRLLVTRNTKDFPKNHPGIRVPYQL